MFILIAINFSFSLYSSAISSGLTFAEQKSYYAKINSDEVYFYEQPNDSETFRKFKLPASYFVLLTADANDKFYSCRYGDLNGYVKKEEVVAMNGTPATPYANFASFRVFALDGIELRSTPYKNPLNVVSKISYLEDNLIYYGSIEGDQLIPKKTKMWYYCKYITEEQTQYGYLYSTFCDELTNIPLNMETFDKIEGELFPVTKPEAQPSKSLSGTVKTLIVVGVSLPCVVIIYLLIKPTLITDSANKKHKQKVRKKRRHGDYFEFDENDLT